jgi:hypothetical protein
VSTVNQLSLVQILVVVANNQLGTLKTEEEKVSMRTAIGHGLVDPKKRGKSAHAGSAIDFERG